MVSLRSLLLLKRPIEKKWVTGSVDPDAQRPYSYCELSSQTWIWIFSAENTPSLPKCAGVQLSMPHDLLRQERWPRSSCELDWEVQVLDKRIRGFRRRHKKKCIYIYKYRVNFTGNIPWDRTKSCFIAISDALGGEPPEGDRLQRFISQVLEGHFHSTGVCLLCCKLTAG